MSLDELRKNEFIDAFLEYTSNTESPKIMKLWSALGSASACMGRHTYMSGGIGNIYPNMFILLVGPPGTRKSKAIAYSEKLVKEYTGVRFAPDDTGSQRQGLITALENEEDLGVKTDDMEMLNNLSVADHIDKSLDLDTVGDIELSINPIDKATLYACASEFGTFMGECNASMTRFLNKVWDGEDYHYKLKSEHKTLKNPLMTIVGATTVSEVARILPPDAIGQGFMSRWVLVFAPNKERKIARPSLDKKLKSVLGEHYAWLHYELSGEIKESSQAAELLDHLYTTVEPNILDSRFIYYAERRHTHLQKLAMCLAAVSHRKVITTEDVEQAQILLEFTETSMPDALGEFGLSPLGAAKQKLLEFLQHAREPVSINILWQVMSRDMKQVDLHNSLKEFEAKKKIKQVTTSVGLCFMYEEALEGMDELLSMIDEGGGE